MDHFSDIWPDRSTRYHAVRRLADQNVLRFVGYHRETGGRPRDVFCGSWNPDKLAHELLLTTPLLALLKDAPYQVERGPFVDQKYRADAEVSLPKHLWRFELLTGSQTRAQLRKRFEVYKDCPDMVLVLVRLKSMEPKKPGDESIRDLGRPYSRCMVFALYDEFVADPWGDVLRLADGPERLSLKRSLPTEKASG